MSDSSNHKNPFTDDPENHSVISSLVQGATRTHRESSEGDESSRKRKRYPSEVNRVKRKITLDLDPETKDDLRTVAQEIGGTKTLSAVSQALIEYALDAYRAGRIEIKPYVENGSIAFEAVDTESVRK